MKKKTNILLYPLWYEEEWGQGRTFQKVAEHLAIRADVCRVICIFPKKKPPTRYSWPISTIKINSKLTLLSTYTRCMPTDLAPFRLRRWINSKIDKICSLYIRLQGFKADNTVEWFFPPLTQTPQIYNSYPSCMTVTQIVDNFLSSDNQSPLHIAAVDQYPMLATRSDLIITGSKPMFEYFNELNGNTHLMENAVDDLFIAPCTELPHKVTSRPPRLGYIGFISVRTDIELLHHIATVYPNYTLVIAGPIHDASKMEFNALTQLANVEYLGAMPYESLPQLISTFDICLIPHKDTPLSRSMSPLKLFQYLGSGRPIVSSNIGGIKRFEKQIYIAKSHTEFIQMIENALQTSTLESADCQISTAKAETWDSRVDKIFNHVQLYLSEKR